MNEVIFGYWHGYTNQEANPVSLTQIPEGVDIISLAFGVIDTVKRNRIDAGQLTDHWSHQEIRNDIAVLKAKGIKVLFSLNGHPRLNNGGWSDLDPEVFAHNVKAFLDYWDLDGIDIDNEDSYMPCVQLTNVIKSLRKSLGKHLIISMPEYMITACPDFQQAIEDQVNYIWTMEYWDDFSGRKTTAAALQKIKRY